MFAGAPRLARVVQQQRQQEQIQPVNLRQQLRQPLLIVMRGLPQSVHIIDRQKSVFVHGIAVIRIPNHQRVNPVKLRDQHLQYAKRVHGSQRMCRVRPQQYFAQRVPKIRALRDVNRQRGQRVGDAVFSGLRKHVPMRGHQREDAQNRAGVVELRPRNNVDAPLVE